MKRQRKVKDKAVKGQGKANEKAGPSRDAVRGGGGGVGHGLAEACDLLVVGRRVGCGRGPGVRAEKNLPEGVVVDPAANVRRVFAAAPQSKGVTKETPCTSRCSGQGRSSL